jgi:hypothetical protein
MRNIVVALVLLMTGCCKDRELDTHIIDIPLGSIVAEIDGVPKMYVVDAIARLDTVPGTFNRQAALLEIYAKESNHVDSESMLIQFYVQPARAIEEGTYPDLNKHIYQYLEFKREWRNNLYTYKSNTTVDNFYSSTSTITRVDSVIQGVFEGNVIIGVGAPGDEQPPTYHKIKKGKFNVSLER